MLFRSTVRELLEMAEEKKRRSERENEERARAREQELAKEAMLTSAADPHDEGEVAATEEQPESEIAEEETTSETKEAPEAQDDTENKNDQE